jgi:hypothetical protein
MDYIAREMGLVDSDSRRLVRGIWRGMHARYMAEIQKAIARKRPGSRAEDEE